MVALPAARRRTGDDLVAVNTILLRTYLAAITAAPALARAAEEPSERPRLWWMWVAVALLLLAALVAIFAGRDPHRGDRGST
jgi:hypothetical protein